jgi:hypothetical protein
MTTTITRAELGAALRALADGLACVDPYDPEVSRVLTHIVDRLAALAAQEHDPEIVNAMRTVAARCAQAAEAITARHLEAGGAVGPLANGTAGTRPGRPGHATVPSEA